MIKQKQGREMSGGCWNLGWELSRADLSEDSRRVQTCYLAAEQAMLISGRSLQGLTSVLVNLLRKKCSSTLSLGWTYGIISHNPGYTHRAICFRLFGAVIMRL